MVALKERWYQRPCADVSALWRAGHREENFGRADCAETGVTSR